MPRPGLRSRAQARKVLRTPGGRDVTHYWRVKPKSAHCSICKKPLKGIPRLRNNEMKKTPHTSRRANRMESGRYCANCLKMLLKDYVHQQPK